MASFVYTWNATFESVPPDTGENASNGASRIRDFKKAVRERIGIDHYIDGDEHDGKHSKVTLKVQGSDPVLETDDGALYTKTVSSATRLFYLPQGGDAQEVMFPAGTKMLFQQTSAPTGWTKDATHNNKALRVVTGSTSSGGTRSFTSAFSASRGTSNTAPGTNSAGGHTHGGTQTHTLTVSELPPHSHPYLRASSSIFVSGGGGQARHATINAQHSTSNTGGGQGHSHGISNDGSHSHTVDSHGHTLALDVEYVDLIIATKD